MIFIIDASDNFEWASSMMKNRVLEMAQQNLHGCNAIVNLAISKDVNRHIGAYLNLFGTFRIP